MQADFDMAIKTKDKLIEEIKNNSNLYFNSDIITKYLD